MDSEPICEKHIGKSTDVRAVKEYDSSSYGAILVGSNPTLCITQK